MRKILYVFLGLVLVNSLMFSEGEINEKTIMEADLEPAHISYVEGIVSIGRDKAEMNMPVTEDNTVETKNGRAEIEFGRGGCLWLDKNTKVLFIFLGREAVELKIEYGNAYIQVGTKNVDVFAAKEQILLNQTGIHRIEVNGNKVEKFNQLEIVDDFDEFVASRTEATQTNSEYLPEELSEYESALEANGNWRYHRVYGYIWVPVVSANWRPYLHGRWIYYPGWGKVWISYDGPWGWVVFHFGRWQYHSNWGWYWIPGTYWSPAWVHWYYRGSYVSWCPMWYSSSYYSYYQYYYSYTYSLGWSTIHKSQLSQQGNVSRNIVRKNELKRRAGNKIRLSDLKTDTIQGKTQLRNAKLRVSNLKTKTNSKARASTNRITQSSRKINGTAKTFPSRINTNQRQKIDRRNNSKVIRKKSNIRSYIPRISSKSSRSRINSIRSKIHSRSRISSITKSISRRARITKTKTVKIKKRKK